MQKPSLKNRCRGASSVHAIVLVSAALIAAVGFGKFATSVGKKTGCLGGTVETLRAGVTGNCGSDTAATPAAPVNGGAAGGGAALATSCDSSGKCTGTSCFAAGTPVLTASGLRPIEAIEAGDLVRASDPESGEVHERRVLRTMRRPATSVVALSVTRTGDTRETVITTHEHPFWVQGRGWVAAGSLRLLDVLASTRGETRVTSLEEREDVREVYNLEVEDLHTYFVGTSSVLVHNDCDKDKPKEGEGEGPKLNLGRGPLRLWDDLGDGFGAEWSFRAQARAPGSGESGKLAKKILDDADKHAETFQRTDPRPLRPKGGLGGLDDLRRLNDMLRPPNRKLDAVPLRPADPKNPNRDLLDLKRNPGRFAILGPEAMERLQKLKGTAELPRRKFNLEADPLADGSRRYALQLAFEENNGYSKLADVLIGDGTRDEKDAAAALLGPMITTFDTPYRRFSDLEKAREAYLGHTRGDFTLPGVKIAAPVSPLDADVTKKLYAKNLVGEITRSRKDPDAPLSRLAKLLYAKELLQNPDYKDNIRSSVLEKALKDEFEKPAVVKALTDVHKATTDVIKASDDYKDHVAMLGSKSFSDGLVIMKPADAAKAMQSELAKVMLVDADKARELAGTIQRNIALEHGRQAVHEHIEDIIRQHGAKDPDLAQWMKNGKIAPDSVKRLSKVASEFVKALKEEGKAISAQRAGAMLDELGKVHKLSKEESKLLKYLKLADEKGAASAFASTLGLLATLEDMGKATTAKDYMKVSAGIAKFVDSTESFVKFGHFWFRAEYKTASNITAKELAGVSKLAKVTALLKVIGPVADAVSAFADGMSAYDNYKKGKIGESICDGVMFASSATCAVFGGLFVTGAMTGPAAPIVLAVGTVVYIGAAIWKQAIAVDDDMVLIKELGLYEMSPKQIKDREWHEKALQRSIKRAEGRDRF